MRLVRFNEQQLTDLFDFKKFTPHPGYGTEGHRHDIAVIKLQRILHFSKFVYPACLYTKTFDLPATAVHILTHITFEPGA